MFRRIACDFVENARRCHSTLSVPRLLFLGAPGSGKGTYASRVASHLKVPSISSGDMLREETASGSELGQRIKHLIDAGNFVPDSMISDMVQKRLVRSDVDRGYVLDGYPRNVPQAECLSAFANAPTLAILLQLREDIIVRKMAGRRLCAGCGAGYNLVSVVEPGVNMPAMPPQHEGRCDRCSGPLVQRADDAPAVVQQRLRTYEQQSAPVVAFYEQKGILHRFDVSGGVADRLKDLLALLTSLGVKPTA